MADGLLQYFKGYDIFWQERITDPQGHIRLTGPFSHNKPILGILLTWLSFPVCMHLLMTENGQLRKGKALAVAMLFSLAVLCMVALSGERMALLLLLLGWFIAVLLMKSSKYLLLALVLGGVSVLGLMAIAVPDIFDRQVRTTITTFTHWQESPYGKIMASDFALAEKNPLFGVGANHFRIACPELYPDADEDFLKSVCNIHPHNIFMEWLIEEGIIGFTLFLLFIGNVFIACKKAWPLQHNPLFLGWAIAFMLRVWPIGSTTGFFSNWGAPPFWLALGLLLVYTASYDQGTKDNAGTSLPL